jgi:cytosine/adenosine deaminase-related metal-dependent hydrolase
MTLVIDNCAIATVDAAGTEHAAGHIVIDDGRITAVGEGSGPQADTRLDGRGCLATPGLVNCHHHLYQWATRGHAQQSTLFEWLVALYPVWQHIDAAIVDAAARAGLAALARSGCTTSTDHHYIFPSRAGDLLEVEIGAARAIGLRFHPCRGAMDLGRSAGGLPPDDVVEDRDAILAASAEAIDRFHDPAPGAMVRIALAPTSPFSVTGELMRETAELARARGVRLHTHLAETDDEEEFCMERFGVRPMEYVESLGWLGEDVWLAHCVHLDGAEVEKLGATGTGVAHCPTSNGRLGAGIAPVPALLAAGTAVGLGVDGAASNECGELVDELRAALVLARVAHGPAALTARDALEMATRHGARCLGREDELGHLSAGALADVALWDLDQPGFAGVADPVFALAFGPTRPVHTLLVGGRAVVAGGELTTADPVTLAADLRRESARLAP